MTTQYQSSLFLCLCLALLFSACRTVEPLPMPTSAATKTELASSSVSDNDNRLLQICEGDPERYLKKTFSSADSEKIKQQFKKMIPRGIEDPKVNDQLKCLLQTLPPLIKD